MRFGRLFMSKSSRLGVFYPQTARNESEIVLYNFSYLDSRQLRIYLRRGRNHIPRPIRVHLHNKNREIRDNAAKVCTDISTYVAEADIARLQGQNIPSEDAALHLPRSHSSIESIIPMTIATKPETMFLRPPHDKQSRKSHNDQ